MADAKMFPINGGWKAKRIKWSDSVNEVSWAYITMLREYNETRKVYAIDPYIEVYQFRDNLYGLYHPNCDGASDVWMWLIVGPEKAMLIDTAYGLGDLKGLCDFLSGGKELIVVNTHTGPDHVLGNFRFDKVYCHEYEVGSVRNKCTPNAFDYLFDENGNNIYCEFDKEDLPKYREYELIGVPDGTIFNLGEDYDIELVWTAGHAPGHAMYIDKKGRNIFAGDDVCSDTIGCGNGYKASKPLSEKYSNIKTYRDCLAKLVRRFDEFDHVFPGHYMVDVENNVLLNILDTLNAIVEDPECYSYKKVYHTGEGDHIEKYYKFVEGFGTVSYVKEGVYPAE